MSIFYRRIKNDNRKAKSIFKRACKQLRSNIPSWEKWSRRSFLTQLTEALEARELIKIKVLENSGLGAREVSNYICEKIGCEGIQAIGSKIVLYKKSSKKPKIEIPNK